MRIKNQFIFIFLLFGMLDIASAEDSIDSTVSECEVKRIATGEYFLIDMTKGRLNLKASALSVLSDCGVQVNAWIDACIDGGGSSEACTKQSLSVTQTLVKDGWNHRNNLKEWLDFQLGGSNNDSSQDSNDGDIVMADNPQFIESILKSDPIEVNGHMVKLWDRRDYKQPYQFSTKGTVLSSKAQVEFDCTKKMFRFHDAFFYSKNRWEGEVVEKIKQTDKWQYVQADTGGEKEMKYACERRRNPRRAH